MKYSDWIKELKSEDKAHKSWRERARKVVKRYEDEEEREGNQYNILWSNVEVIHGAVYNKVPSPDIRRRYLDRDPVGREVSELAERAVSYSIDTYDFDGGMDISIDNYLIAGMGNHRLRYEPFFSTGEPPRVPLERREIGMDEDYNPIHGYFDGEEQKLEYEQDEEGFFYLGEPEEELVHEKVTSEPVNWDRFRYQPAERWEAVDWVCIEHYKTKEELKADYSEEDVEQIPLMYTEKGIKSVTEDDKHRALIHEIFDKKNRKYITLAEGYDKILQEIDDPLSLEGFYPFPKPLVTTLKNGKFIPIPDYVFYQDQAEELDTITGRINGLTEQLVYRGVYDSSFEALQNIAAASDGEFLPIDDYNERFDGKGDLSSVIAHMPIDEIQKVLLGLYRSREEVKQTIYEITGIADIMRGSTKSNETLGAQQLKTQFGSMRLEKRRKRVDRFIREIVQLTIEIMVENFQIEVLEDMTGVEITEEMQKVMTDDLMRSYRIDIETDSTITEDASEEKSNRIELIKAVTEFMEKVYPLVDTGIMPMPVAKELLGFTVRGFKIGRTLEDSINEMGGDDKDPRLQQMQGEMERQVGEMKQQAGEHIQAMEEESQKKIQALEKQLFEAQKKLAINAESSKVRIAEAQIKGEIATTAQKDKNDINARLEMFKAQLDAILSKPEQNSRNIEEVVQSIVEAFGHQQKVTEETFSRMSQEINDTRKGLTDVSEYMRQPAIITRDEQGRVTGATRG